MNIGVGMDNKPTIAVKLLPKEHYQFMPESSSYYILRSHLKTGQIIDPSLISDGFKIDFEDWTTMSLRFNENNKFEPM